MRWADGGRHGARGGVALRGHSNLCASSAFEDYGTQARGGHGAWGDEGDGSGGERWRGEAVMQGEGGAAADGGQGHGRGSEAGGQGSSREGPWGGLDGTGRVSSGRGGAGTCRSGTRRGAYGGAQL